jgi:hypothetical protein
MSYSFLPVNPCCTDVVLNDPCGCSSVTTNSGCNNHNPCSTHLTASSTIVYDGPALSCTTAEPCDTLNVILQKIDEIICNLLTQINVLTVQVNSITTQIITINGDIININNTLDVCCNVTTTTTTTASPCSCNTYTLVGPNLNPGNVTYVPCEATEVVTIEASDILQFICVDNTYDVIAIGNVNIIDTFNCCTAPSTTTTTTTLVAVCIEYDWEAIGVNESNLVYIDCNGSEIIISSSEITDNSGTICVQYPNVPYWLPVPTEGFHQIGTSSISCAPTTTTTTTCPCASYTITGIAPGGEASFVLCGSESITNIAVSDVFFETYCIEINDGITKIGGVLIGDPEGCCTASITTTTTTTIL